MEEEKQLSGEESLQLITTMLQKAKGGFHEKGTSAILWGSVVAIAGLVSFAELYWDFSIRFDIWIIVLAAIVPQIFISIKESRERKARSYDGAYLSAIWTVYGISMFALMFYVNIMPSATQRILTAFGTEWFSKNLRTGELTPLEPYVVGRSSIFLILFSIPTLTTGMATRFKPMIIGSLLCYGFFVISCFVINTYDMLLLALAGIFNWLIPGIILRRRYLKGKCANV